MSTFTYLAKEKTGSISKGSLEALNRKEAISLLSEKGLTPIRIESQKQFGNFKSTTKISNKKKVNMVRQLSTLINAGVPLAQAFAVLGRQAKDASLKIIVNAIQKDLEGGLSLSNGLSKHPKVFSEVFINMIKAGEAGGSLDQTLDRLATQMEKDREIVSKVRGALMYPAVITVAMIGVVIFLMVKIVPQISSIFADMGSDLPINTKILIAISNAFSQFFVGFIVGAAILIYAYIWSYRHYEKMRFFVGKTLTRIPMIKEIVLKVNISRMTRTLASLLSSGIPVIEAIDIVANSLSNQYFKNKIGESKQFIKNGQNLSVSLEKTGALPEDVKEMIAIGEETGNLEDILFKIAEVNEKELYTLVDGLSSVIEPILMLVLGGIVGFIVISMLQPIYSLGDSI